MARSKRLTGKSSCVSFRPRFEQLEDRAVPSVDVSVTKTDGLTTVAAGQTVQYTVVVANDPAATQTAAAIPFADAFTNLTGVSYTSTASAGASTTQPSSGTVAGSPFVDTISLAPGATVTYTFTGTVLASAPTGTAVTNTASVDTTGYTDTDTTNNSATDTDTVQPLDLAVSKTDNLTSATPGQAVTYTIVVSNVGLADASGATLTDTLPVQLTGAMWTSSAAGGATGNTPTGSGNINEMGLILPVGSSITYTVTGTVDTATPSGTTISNTATVGAPAGTTDQDTTDNAATDTTLVTNQVNVRVTKTDGARFADAGQDTTYTITVTNLGGTTATGVQVQDPLPAGVSGATWTSASSAGASGSAGTGTGAIGETLTLAPGASVTYTLKATVADSATGTLTNTATLALPGYLTDADPADNAASDTDTVVPQAVQAFADQYAVGADAGAQGHVEVFSPDGTLRQSFLAFAGFNGGVRVAAGDVNGDGVNDILVGAGPGAPGGHVKVFDGITGALIASFFSFEGYTGGVNVAVGDVDNDGFGDLIVGSGLGASHVKVFSLATGSPVLIGSFLTYPGFTGGITVAAGDVNGDDHADIITGTSIGPAHLKVFSLATGVPENIFSQVYLPGYVGGISVAAGNLRGDSRAEFLLAPLSGGIGGTVQVFSIDSASPVAAFTPSLPAPDVGLRLAVADADNDGDNDVLVGSGLGRQALVQAYDGASLGLVRQFTAFENFLGGIYLG